MTLTELRYIVALAREKHFGRASRSCFVSQPTLSLAIKKFEDELGVTLFERGSSDIVITSVGEEIVAQAQRVLEEAEQVKSIAQYGRPPFSKKIRLGLIHTVGPYLLQRLIPQALSMMEQVPLIIAENFTTTLLEQLRSGDLDVVILATPFPDNGLLTSLLYQEPFVLAVPRNHRLAKKQHASLNEIREETMLILGAGHCMRDHVLDVCPEFIAFTPAAQGIQRSFEGSSVETLRHMVACGIGVTLLPILAKLQDHIHYLDITPVAPMRTIVMAWRKSFPYSHAITWLRQAIDTCHLPGVVRHQNTSQ